ILVDAEAFHTLLMRAFFNHSDMFKSALLVKNSLMKSFPGLDVEFFFDGDGNVEKYSTSMQRRNKTSALDTAEANIAEMEQQAINGRGIKKMAFKKAQKALRSSVSPTIQFKAAVVQALLQGGANAVLCPGEADLAIR
ncbi:hypothetical protein BGZ47_005122, partial [Haplosporangium gracile]